MASEMVIQVVVVMMVDVDVSKEMTFMIENGSSFHKLKICSPERLCDCTLGPCGAPEDEFPGSY